MEIQAACERKLTQALSNTEKKQLADLLKKMLQEDDIMLQTNNIKLIKRYFDEVWNNGDWMCLMKLLLQIILITILECPILFLGRMV